MSSYSDSVSQICEFYNSKNIFVTGATGFVGKFLIEKLISATNVKHIYILIRAKKGKSIQDRFQEYKNDQVFKFRCDKEKLDRVLIPISGDLLDDNLGICQQDEDLLCDEIDIIIHSAATVRFDEELSVAMKMNVIGTQKVLNLALNCPNLKSFVYVSTAFVNSHIEQLGEYYKPMSVDLFKLIEDSKNCDETYFNTTIHDNVIGNHPNTYTFTKNMAEQLVHDYFFRHSLPIIIARPAIIAQPVDPELDCYIDSLNQATGSVIAVLSLGLLRTIAGRPDGICALVPVDRVVNSIITCGLVVYKQSKKIPKLNIVGIYSKESFRFLNESKIWAVYNVSKNIAAKEMLRPPAMVTYIDKDGNIFQKIRYYANFYYHDYLYALFLDILTMLSFGKYKNFRAIIFKVQRKLSPLSFFLSRQWPIHGHSLIDISKHLSRKDNELFNCHDLPSENGLAYGPKWLIAILKYQFKVVDLDSPRARNHMKRIKKVKLAFDFIRCILILAIVTLFIKLLFLF